MVLEKAYTTGVFLLTALLVLGACAPAPTPEPSSTPAPTEDLAAELQSRITALEEELSAKEATIDALQQEIQEKQNKIEQLERALEKPPEPVHIPAPPSVKAANIQITYIFYDGLVTRVESDEYVEITNLGDQSQDLGDWVLKDISDGQPSFTFPSYSLAPGESIRVYTNEYHPEWGGFSFESSRAIWSNSEPDIAALYDSQGEEVSRKSY